MFFVHALHRYLSLAETALAHSNKNNSYYYAHDFLPILLGGVYHNEACFSSVMPRHVVPERYSPNFV
jgi:hypothetical protein